MMKVGSTGSFFSYLRHFALRSLASDRWLVVRYEDLLQDTRTVLVNERIIQFSGHTAYSGC